MEEKKPRGFAAMTPERRKEIAIKGGKTAQAQGRGHQFTPDEARAAGKKGGATTAAIHGRMAELGRMKGKKNDLGN